MVAQRRSVRREESLDVLLSDESAAVATLIFPNPDGTGIELFRLRKPESPRWRYGRSSGRGKPSEKADL